MYIHTYVHSYTHMYTYTHTGTKLSVTASRALLRWQTRSSILSSQRTSASIWRLFGSRLIPVISLINVTPPVPGIGPAVRADFRRLYPANSKTPTCCPSDDNRTKVTNSVTSARSLWWHVGLYFWPADLTRTANPGDLRSSQPLASSASSPTCCKAYIGGRFLSCGETGAGWRRSWTCQWPRAGRSYCVTPSWVGGVSQSAYLAWCETGWTGPHVVRGHRVVPIWCRRRLPFEKPIS